MSNSKKINRFKKTLLASLCIATAYTHGAVVRSDVDYQLFRDMSENKGQFAVGASNIDIYHKDTGELIGTVLPNVPMPSFESVDRLKGATTLIDPQYAVSVAHNDGNRDFHWHMQFGGQGNLADAHYYNYAFVDKNNYANNLNARGSEPRTLDTDYQAPRLSKLVTEVVPSEVAEPIFQAKDYTTDRRYSAFMRVGAGRQYVREPSGETTDIQTGYKYRIAGTVMPFTGIDAMGHIHSGGLRNQDENGQWIDHVFAQPMVNYPASGDSGSAYYGYDKALQRWVLIAVHQAGTPDKNDLNGSSSALIARPEYHRNIMAQDRVPDVQVKSGEHFNWSNTTAGTTTLQSNEQSITVKTPIITTNMPANGYSGLREELNAGKTVRFTGESGTLNLKNNIDQGAGALYFDNNFTVTSDQPDHTWLGAGVSIADGKTVDWQVKNPQNDRLSKLGKGTLVVNGTGVNHGDISVGEGTVILAQRANSAGQRQAFNEVGIVSGRPTVVLSDAQQVKADNIYFGHGGGRLDVHGNNLTFSYIQNVDQGAQLVNHHQTQSANITIQGKSLFGDNERITNLVGSTTEGFYRLLGSTRALGMNARYPTNKQDNLDWKYIGTDRYTIADNYINQINQQRLTSVFHGILGETDTNKHNGQLNVTFAPKAQPQNATLVLTGGANLNGTLTAQAGTLLLSGRPTPHAVDKLTGKEVIDHKDWLTRDFHINELKAEGNAKLVTGRNVGRLTTNLTTSQNATAHLGYIDGVTPTCVRSDYHGETQCAVLNFSQEELNSIPITQVLGNVTLNDRSQLSVGKAHVTGKVTAGQNSTMNILSDGHLTLTDNSTIGTLNLTQGSQVTLNNAPSANQAKKFNVLHITKQLSGNGRFNYLTNTAQVLGDKVQVDGVAQGDFQLYVQDTGVEPTKTTDDLVLLQLSNTHQHNVNVQLANPEQVVDVGAYRYRLKQDNHQYRLYNPKANEPLITAKGDSVKAEPLPVAEMPLITAKGDSVKAEPLPVAEMPLITAKGDSVKAEPLPVAEMPLITAKGDSVKAEPLPVAEMPLITAKGDSVKAEPLPVAEMPLITAKGDSVKAEPLPVAEMPLITAKGDSVKAEPLPVAEMPLITAKGDSVKAEPLPVAEMPLITAKGDSVKAEPLPVAEMPLITAKGASVKAEPLPVAEMPLITAKGASVKAEPLPVAEMPLITAKGASVKAEPLPVAEMPLITAKGDSVKAEPLPVAEMPLITAKGASVKAEPLPVAEMPLITAKGASVKAEPLPVAEMPLITAKGDSVKAEPLPVAEMPLITAKGDSVKAEPLPVAEMPLITAKGASVKAEPLPVAEMPLITAKGDSVKAEPLPVAEMPLITAKGDSVKAEPLPVAEMPLITAKGDSVKAEPLPVAEMPLITAKGASVKAEPLPVAEMPLITAKGDSVKAEPLPVAEMPLITAKGASVKAEPLPVAEMPLITAKGDSVKAEPLPVAEMPLITAKGDSVKAEPLPVAELPPIKVAKGTSVTAQTLPEMPIYKIDNQHFALPSLTIPDAIVANGLGVTANTLPTLTLNEQDIQRTEQPIVQAITTVEQVNQRVQHYIEQLKQLKDKHAIQTMLYEMESVLVQAETAVNELQALEKQAILSKTQQEIAETLNNAQQLSTLAKVAQHNATLELQTQADWISRYTNTALSDLSAQANSLIYIDNSLTRHILADRKAGVWVNADRYKETQHQSDLHRPFKKQETLTQIGADFKQALNEHELALGLALSHSQADNQFADNIKGEHDLTMLSSYGKLTFKNDGFISLDAGYGQSENKLKSATEQVKFKRDVVSAGVNIGKTFKTPILDIQPSVGVRYHRFSGGEYSLNGAKIEMDSMNLTRYRAGVVLEKAIPLKNGLELKPTLASHYIDAHDGQTEIRVNNIDGFQQEFGRYSLHEMGLSLAGTLWDVTLNANYAKGKDVHQQQSVGLKVRYQW